MSNRFRRRGKVQPPPPVCHHSPIDVPPWWPEGRANFCGGQIAVPTFLIFSGSVRLAPGTDQRIIPCTNPMVGDGVSPLWSCSQASFPWDTIYNLQYDCVSNLWYRTVTVNIGATLASAYTDVAPGTYYTGGPHFRVPHSDVPYSHGAPGGYAQFGAHT